MKHECMDMTWKQSECLSSGKRYHVLDQRSTTGGPLSRPCCLCSSKLIGWFIPKGQNVNTEFYKTLCFCSTVTDIALSSASSTMNAPCLQICHHKQIFGEKHSIAPTSTILPWPYSKSLFVPTTLESNEISLIWLNWSDLSQCNERSQIWSNWRDSSQCKETNEGYCKNCLPEVLLSLAGTLEQCIQSTGDYFEGDKNKLKSLLTLKNSMFLYSPLYFRVNRNRLKLYVKMEPIIYNRKEKWAKQKLESFLNWWTDKLRKDLCKVKQTIYH